MTAHLSALLQRTSPPSSAAPATTFAAVANYPGGAARAVHFATDLNGAAAAATLRTGAANVSFAKIKEWISRIDCGWRWSMRSSGAHWPAK